MAEIMLQKVVVHAAVGATPGERSHKQQIELGVRVEYPSSRAILLDRLEHAIDYGELLSLARKAAEEKEFHLLESLADHVATRILKHFRKARRVLVEATKPRVNQRKHARIAVRVERKR